METAAANKIRILLVEDDKFLRELYAEILKDEGYEVAEAKDGQEGYQEIVKGGYDLVLLDIILPKIDGFSILKKIKTEKSVLLPNKAIVILTNLDHTGPMSKAEELGIAGYIVKSNYTPNQLVDEIKKFLNINSSPPVETQPGPASE
jgi:DNA-binding response OmpR family regulator